MTIMQALDALDREKPNVFTQEEKVSWLNELEAIVLREIILTHESGEFLEGLNDESLLPLFCASPGDTEKVLTAPPPYDRMYPLYLAAQVDRLNGEIAKYNNSITLFVTAYGEYRNWYNRTHMPKGDRVRYW